MLTTIVGSAIALVGILIGLWLSQRNRREDKHDAHQLEDTNARVQDSKNALDAWVQISAAHSQQIATLDARVLAAEARAARCEDETVPRMQTVIDAQRATIADVLERIEKLEGLGNTP